MILAPSLTDRLSQAKALVFDFDGTLVDSTGIKQRAFEACFTDVSEKKKEILDYCWGNNHVPRDVKFRHVYERILNRPYTPQMEQELHRRFASMTTRQISEAPALPGAEKLLRSLASRKTLALLSSTPQRPLLEILEGRGWRQFFQVIQGAPVDKAGWLRGFIKKRLLDPAQTLFFGDTTEDLESAKTAGCLFVGVRNPDLQSKTPYFLTDFSEHVADVL